MKLDANHSGSLGRSVRPSFLEYWELPEELAEVLPILLKNNDVFEGDLGNLPREKKLDARERQEVEFSGD